MTRVAPPPPAGPGEPSNRWPWVALLLGLVIILAAVIFFFVNRQPNTVINIEGTPTAKPVAGSSSPSAAPPTLAPPTAPTSAPLAASPTSIPAPTKPAATSPPPPSPTPVVIVVTATPQPAVPAPPAGSSGTPAATSGTSATAAPQATAATQATSAATPTPATPATPTAFAGQVSNAGGVGNQRSDLDASLGAPAGETPQHLVVYRKNNFEFHVQFVPDPNGRAAVIVEQPQNAQPVSLQQAQTDAHNLLPKDAQPPNPSPEGNDQFVVERYTSQTLAAALPPEAFTSNGGQPGQLMIVYVKDAQGRITRWIIGPGNDPNALIKQSG